MRAPAFWWRSERTAAASILAPLGAVYGALTAARMNWPGVRAGVPVVCVGNLVVGGAGKTPLALGLARLLLAAGQRPAFLSRGYGRANESGTEDRVVRVDAERYDAELCGDEPMLLARIAPTYVSADRVRAARAAVADGATVLVLDDGLQNPALVKDFTIAVVDGVTGVGNGLCLPAGPLRAPVGRQWPHVSLVVIVGRGAAGERLGQQADRASLPVLRASLLAERAAAEQLHGRRLLAFAGIGRPEKFFSTLEENGLTVVGRKAFPDHHRFGASDLAMLRAEARAADAILVTTAKDRVRLPADFRAEVLPVDLAFDDPDALTRRLAGLF